MSFLLSKDSSQEIIYSEIAYKGITRKQKIINTTLIRLHHLLSTQIAPTHINILKVNRSKAENREGLFIPRNSISWVGRHQSIMFEVRSKIIFSHTLLELTLVLLIYYRDLWRKWPTFLSLVWVTYFGPKYMYKQMKKTICEGSIIVEIVYTQNLRKSNLWFPWQL